QALFSLWRFPGASYLVGSNTFRHSLTMNLQPFSCLVSALRVWSVPSGKDCARRTANRLRHPARAVSLSGGSCLSRSCLRLGLVRVSGLRPPRLQQRLLQLPLLSRRPAFNSAGSPPCDFPPAFLNAVPPAQLDSRPRFLRPLAPFGVHRRFRRFCVSMRANVSAANFLRFLPQRQAAVAFPAFHWPLTRCPRETNAGAQSNFASPCRVGMRTRSPSNLLPAACAHRANLRSQSEPSSSCAGRKCSLPIRYWATN